MWQVIDIEEVILALLFLTGITSYVILQSTNYLNTYKWLLNLSIFILCLLFLDIFYTLCSHLAVGRLRQL